mmetsp:Transcript_5280/g.13136  ORF Transcript_5280/g.13136 Transcript_5280/m.13136 type:complete len:232 (-) Transcript_5280:272-967(-)
MLTDDHDLARQLFHKTRVCTFWLAGRCTRAGCRFAHGESELMPVPDLSKTTLCRVFRKRGVCRPDCRFAHGTCELRDFNRARDRKQLDAFSRVVRSVSAADAQPTAWQSQGRNNVEAMDGNKVVSCGPVAPNGGQLASGGELATQHWSAESSSASTEHEEASHRHSLELAPRPHGGAIAVNQRATRRLVQPGTIDDRALYSQMLLRGCFTPTDRFRYAKMLEAALPEHYED